MEEENIHTGFFEINGNNISSEVLSWSASSHLHVGELKSRIFIDLYVFNAAIFSRVSEKSLSESHRYSISGPKCAMISRSRDMREPSDSWNVDAIEFEFIYKKRRLSIQLIGKSNRGFSSFSMGKDDLDAIEFRVGFTVQDDHLQNYLKLSDSAWGFFQNELSKAQGLD